VDRRSVFLFLKFRDSQELRPRNPLLSLTQFLNYGLRMSSIKDLKAAQKAAAEQRRIMLDLDSLVDDIERCERTIFALKLELEKVNRKHQGPRDTRQDVEYLSALLDCAKRKLAWEKQIGSIQKRTPDLLARMQRQLNDEKNPPVEDVRNQMLRSLHSLQSTMERLQAAKVE
jgi:hypothetical protein